MELQDLLDQLNADGADPAAILADLPAEDLAALESATLAEFDTLRSSAENSDETMETLEALADAAEALRTEGARRDEQAAARAERVAALATRVSGEKGTDGDGDDTDGDDNGDDGDDTDGDDNPPEGGATVPAPGSSTEDEKELVTASTGRPRRRPDLRAAARRAPGKATAGLTKRPSVTIKATTDTHGNSGGQVVRDVKELGKIAAARFAAFPDGLGGQQLRTGIGTIERPFPSDLMATGGDRDWEIIEHAANPARLDNGAGGRGSLLAAGGWCAPSETLYDINVFSTISGIWSTPEIGVKRGGLRWPSSPNFADIYSQTGFQQTEAQNIAGGTKPCYEIGCPDFAEARLDAIGLCIKAGVLQSRGYPEQITAVTGEALNAHAHQVNQEKIKRAVALAGAPITAPTRKLGPFLDSLDVIEMHNEDIRYKYRLAPTAEVEGLAPLWLRGILRTDLQRRYNLTDPSVADAALTARFKERGIAVQWVYDWQDAFSNAPGASDAGLFGGPTPISDYPTSVDFMMYPAGTFIVANDPILRLEGIYDSVNIQTNTFTALFSEESLLVAKRNLEARLLRIPLDRRFPTS